MLNHNAPIHKLQAFIFPELYETKKCVKNDTLSIKNFLRIYLLNDENELINFMLILSDEPGVSPMTHQTDSNSSGLTHFLKKITHLFDSTVLIFPN